MCRVTHCCGFSLEKGCKTLAIHGLVFGGLGLLFSFFSANNNSPRVDAILNENFPTLVLTNSIIGTVVIVIYIISNALLLWGTL